MKTYRAYRLLKTSGKSAVDTLRGSSRLFGYTGVVTLGAFLALLTLGGYQRLFAQASHAPLSTANLNRGDAAKGKKIFAAERCDICHGAKGQGALQPGVGIAGPRISPPPKSFSRFAAIIRRPHPPMPAYDTAKLSDREIGDLYAFLKPGESSRGGATAAMIAPRGSAEKGKETFTKDGCAECHGHHAEGSKAPGTGPRLSPPPLEFDAFISYVRHPIAAMPPYTDKVISDAELADIYAFLRSLPPPPDVKNIPLLDFK